MPQGRRSSVNAGALQWLTALVVFALAAPPLPAAAFTVEEDAQIEDIASLDDLIPPAPDGAIAWKSLAATEEIETEIDGEPYILPGFSEEVRALDRKTVRIKGFMYPLEQAERQSHFLLSAYPPHCAFCLPAGPNMLIEVASAKPVEFTYEPVLVSGRLELLDNDPTGLFYRLSEARVVE